MLDGNELQLLFLKLIAEKPRHGYELIRAVEELTGGAYAPSPGIAYPTLALLKDLELVGEREADGRRTFSITDKGREHLRRDAATAKAVIARLGAMAAVRERADAGPVRRAMHNLRSALFEKLSSELPRQTLLDIAAVLDEAAQKIERLE